MVCQHTPLSLLLDPVVCLPGQGVGGPQVLGVRFGDVADAVGDVTRDVIPIKSPGYKSKSNVEGIGSWLTYRLPSEH